jgi:hypothetical protein
MPSSSILSLVQKWSREMESIRYDFLKETAWVLSSSLSLFMVISRHGIHI